MPFTFSHPAIVLPFKFLWKNRFSTTALVAGSITPDFEYFGRFHNWSAHSHTWSGIFWFDIPVGLLLCFLFHEVIKVPLFTNLPVFLHQRLMRFADFNWKKYFVSNWVIVLSSLLLGILSHLLWDKFTHQSYRFFEAVPNIDDSLDPDFHPTRVYRIIQISYSMFGLAVITYALLRMPADESLPRFRKPRPYWILLTFLTGAILGFVILFTGLEFVDWIVTIISCGLIALTIGSFLMLEDKWVFAKEWR